MEQIERLANLVNMEPLLVILIGAGILLVIFGLAAFWGARRRKRVAEAREKARKKAGGIEAIASSCERINKPFSTILRACSELPGGEGFLKQEEVAASLRELEENVASRTPPTPRKTGKSGKLSLVDYSARPAETDPPAGSRKSMVRFIRALYMDRGMLQAVKDNHAPELRNAVESLTE